MEFKRADQVNFDVRSQMSRIFVEGFYLWLNHFSKDKEKLMKAFAHIFILKHFFVMVKDNEVISMAACIQSNTPIQLERKMFSNAFGWVRGNFAYYLLNRHVGRNAYPFNLSKHTGSIEYVATAKEYQGQGVGYDLLTHIMKIMPYTAYVLEVADTNIGAVKLYDRLGFKEFKRVKAANRRRTGVNFFLYMRRDKPQD